jgi:hypothetical protein
MCVDEGKKEKVVEGKFMLMEIFFTYFCTVCMEKNGKCGGGNESFSFLFLMLLDINDVDGRK